MITSRKLTEFHSAEETPEQCTTSAGLRPCREQSLGEGPTLTKIGSRCLIERTEIEHGVCELIDKQGLYSLVSTMLDSTERRPSRKSSPLLRVLHDGS